MKLPIFMSIFPAKGQQIESSVDFDCDELIRLRGPQASERASCLSRAEDFGFASKPNAGHWGRVLAEIDRRSIRTRSEPQLTAAA